MAIRNIVKIGDETLRKRSFEVTDFGEKTHQLIDDMKETLIKAEGAGLAAPQVGVLRRIFLVLVDGKYYECVNPELVSASGTQRGLEGCLSVPNKQGVVDRPYKVEFKAQDRYGNPFKVKVSGFTARAFCHEFDHLNGTLYVDKALSVEDDK